MKIRIPKEMYDKISEYALANDMTFDEAIVLCFKIGETVSNTPITQTAKPAWGKQYEPTEDDEA